MGISADGTSDSAALAERKGVRFPLLSDTDLATIRAYGIEHVGKDISLPATIIVDRDGKVAWAYVGDRQTDRPVLPDLLAVLESMDD